MADLLSDAHHYAQAARAAGEMHANQMVYGIPGLLRLRDAVGETVGANGAIHHVHARDTRIE